MNKYTETDLTQNISPYLLPPHGQLHLFRLINTAAALFALILKVLVFPLLWLESLQISHLLRHCLFLRIFSFQHCCTMMCHSKEIGNLYLTHECTAQVSAGILLHLCDIDSSNWLCHYIICGWTLLELKGYLCLFSLNVYSVIINTLVTSFKAILCNVLRNTCSQANRL